MPIPLFTRSEYKSNQQKNLNLTPLSEMHVTFGPVSQKYVQIAPPHYNRSGTFAGRADRTSRTLSASDGAVKHYCVEI